MDYFKDCKTTEECTKKYHEWAKKLHPDVGGNDKDMAELTEQYEAWKPTNRFERSSTMSEAEKFKKSQEAWGKEFENKAQYGGYGGYRFNTVNDMKREYFNQRNDPRLADYERMKKENKSYQELVLKYQGELNKNYRLEKENNELKKKLERLKKKLKNPPKAKKDGKISPSICL